MRSERDKEKTKMRERDRRAITTNIFRGLRKHGGYLLRARADINQVLRHLAAEAGWVIEPDGTTYRPFLQPQIRTRCPLCGSATSATPTPTSSIVDSLMPTSPINLCLEDPAAAETERYSQLHSHQRDPHNDTTMQAVISSEQQIPTSFCVVGEAQPQQQTHLPDMTVS